MIIDSPIFSGSYAATGSLNQIGNVTITGSLTVTGTINASITGSITTASYALSAELLDGLDSTSFVFTSSFNTVSSSFSTRVTNLENFSSSLDATFATDAELAAVSQSFSSSLSTVSGSLSSRVTNNEVTGSNLTTASGSFSTRTTNLELASGSFSTRVTDLETASGSFSTRVTTAENNITNLQNASSSFSTRVTSAENSIVSIQGATGSYATTGSNNFVGTQYISATNNAIGFTTTASLYTDGGIRVAKDMYVSGNAYFNNVTIYGTQSVQYITSSQLNISTNLISVNTDTPAIRFGGLAVYDSGSTQLSGSLLWDSEQNHWVYSNPSGSSYSGGMLISGPRASSLSTEQGTTACALMMGQGGDHITSSAIFHYGNATCFYGNSRIESNGAACFNGTVTSTSLVTTGMSGNVISVQGNETLDSPYGITWTTPTYTGGLAAIRVARRGATDASDMMFYTSPNGDIPSERLRITSTGVVCLSDRICATTGAALGNIVSYSYGAIRGYVGDTDGNCNMQVRAECALTIKTGGNNTRLSIDSSGISCFSCQVCAPAFHATGLNGTSIISDGNFTTGRSDGMFLNQTANAPMVFSTCNCERARITSAGSVGIGTISPIEKLHICGGIAVEQSSDGTGSGIMLVDSSTGNRTIEFRQTTTGKNLAIDTYNSSEGWKTRITLLNSGGCVGIGTTTPTSILNIQSTTVCTLLTVTNCYPASGIADYCGASGIVFQQYGNFVSPTIRNAGRILSIREDNYSTDPQAKSSLVFYTTFSNTDNARLTIDSAGNACFSTAVGINGPVLSSSFALTVWGCAVMYRNCDFIFHQPNGYTNGIVWKNTGYTKDSAAIRPISTAAWATQGLGFYTGDFADNSSAPVLRLAIAPSGVSYFTCPVGINIASPSGILDVRAHPINNCLATLRIGTQCQGGSGDEFANLEFYWGDPDAAEVKAKIFTKNTGNVGPGGGGAASLIFATRTANAGLCNRFSIDSDGISSFCCQVCAPAFVGGTVSGTTGTFSGKLSVSQASTDFVAEFTNTANSTPYGLRVKDAGTPANNYPLLSVTNNAGSAEYFRVNSGTGMTTFTGVVCSACRICSAGLTVEGTFINNGTTGDVAYISSTFATAATNGRVLHIRDNKAAIGTDSYVSVGWTSSPGQDVYIGKRTTSSAGFLAIQNSSATELLTIDLSSANVGIGTTSPGYKAEAAGAIGNYWNGTAFTGTPLAIAISNTQPGGYDPVLLYRQTDSGGTTKLAGGIGVVGRSSWTAGNNGSQVSDMYFLVRNDSGGITERMRIASGGNVGIGTTSPQDKLYVIGADNGITICSATANRPVLNFINGSTSMLKLSANGTYGAIASCTGDLMYFYGNNVGIGTTSPAYALDVSGIASATSLLSGNQGLNVAGYAYLSQTISGAMTILGHNVRASNSVANQVNVVNGGWYSSMIKMYYTEGITFHSSNTSYAAGATFYQSGGTTNEIMRITNGGNVGIGTTSPSALLHVNGSIINSTNVNSTGDPGLLVSSGHRLGFDQSGVRSWNIKATGGNLAFNSGDGAGSYTFVGSSVGIACASPGVTLTVGGTDALRLPTGTTSQRPTTACSLLRFNSDLRLFEGSGADNWGSLGIQERIIMNNYDPYVTTPQALCIVDNADGGGTTWTFNGSGIFGVTNSSGGHSGQWGPMVYMTPGAWRWRWTAVPTVCDGSIHPSTPSDAYKCTIYVDFNINGVSAGGIIYDTCVYKNNTHIGGISTPTYISTAGCFTVSFSTNGYMGVRKIWFKELVLEKLR